MALFSSKNTVELPKQYGRFIVLDGSDSTIKTEQVELLRKTMKVSGYESELIDFPQHNSASAAMLEKYLNGEYGELTPEAVSIIYAVDRFDAGYKIRELLAQGKTVIANRYMTSNAGHQGSKITDRTQRIKFYRWLDQLEYGIFNIPKPDLNIILYSANQEDGGAYEETVFYEIAELFPNTRLIECDDENGKLASNQIHAKVWELVRRIGLKGVEPKI